MSILECAKRRIGETTHKILYGDSPRTTSETLPAGILYALAYKNALLDPNEIQLLIESPYVDQSAYLLMKALSKNEAEQKNFLENFTLTVLNKPNDVAALKSLFSFTAKTLAPEEKVIGTKLAQVNRLGRELWDEKFSQIAHELHQHEPEASPVFRGTGSLLGLRHFLHEYQDEKMSMYILLPRWLIDSENTKAGYLIDLTSSKDRVSFLPKDFSRPEHFHFIDDTLRDGEQAQSTWNFWHSSTDLPYDPAKYSVVVRVPSGL